MLVTCRKHDGMYKKPWPLFPRNHQRCPCLHTVPGQQKHQKIRWTRAMTRRDGKVQTSLLAKLNAYVPRARNNAFVQVHRAGVHGAQLQVLFVVGSPATRLAKCRMCCANCIDAAISITGHQHVSTSIAATEQPCIHFPHAQALCSCAGRIFRRLLCV